MKSLCGDCSFAKKKMNKFKIISLSAEQAEKIRNTGTDDFGLPVTEQIATGYGPCRVSLLPFRLGEDVRLFFKSLHFSLEIQTERIAKAAKNFAKGAKVISQPPQLVRTQAVAKTPKHLKPLTT